MAAVLKKVPGMAAGRQKVTGFQTFIDSPFFRIREAPLGHFGQVRQGGTVAPHSQGDLQGHWAAQQ